MRVLIEKGQYVKYTYINPKTNKIVKQGKESIILKNNKGKKEALFIIPMKEKSLLIRKLDDKKRKIWDKGKVVDLF